MRQRDGHTTHAPYGFNPAIGDRTFINYDYLLHDSNPITIGDEVQNRDPCPHLHGDVSTWSKGATHRTTDTPGSISSLLSGRDSLTIVARKSRGF
jgi:hypothetical protein